MRVRTVSKIFKKSYQCPANSFCVVLFPNCKINLGLYVTAKRPDGFHNLQTCFYPVALHDVLEVIERPPGSETSLTVTGMAVAAGAPNSCLAAYGLLKKLYPSLPPVAIALHKAIPVGGGLGGGSADGAFMLALLNKKFALRVSEEALLEHALQLGSDCPFFIRNTPSLASGRGETLMPVDLQLSGYKLVLVNPGIGVNTGWAFTQIKPAPVAGFAELIASGPEKWRDVLQNVFEAPVFRRHPELGEIKNEMYRCGAVYAAMSGSGASVYGLFKNRSSVELRLPPAYFIKESYLA